MAKGMVTCHRLSPTKAQVSQQGARTTGPALQALGFVLATALFLRVYAALCLASGVKYLWS